MKNIFKIILFILTIITESVNAQNKYKQTDELLIATWQFDFNKSIDSIASSSKKNYDRINDETRNKIKKLYSQRKLSFFSNRQLILEIVPGVQKKGNWQLLSDQKRLHIKMENGKELYQIIEKINDSSLVIHLESNQSNNDKRLFHKWYLNRINP